MNIKKRLPLIAVTFTSALCIAISIFSLKSGYFIVFQNIFYIPIIIACFYYKKHGFAISVALSCIYFFLIIAFTNDPMTIREAVARVIIFILVAAVITALSIARAQTVAILKEERERFRTVADFTYGWEYWTDPQQNMRYVSPSCERISGYRPDDFMMDSGLIQRIVHPDDHDILKCHIDYYHDFNADSVGEVEFRILNRNGEERFIAHICQPVYSSDGQFLGRRASNRDITERKQVEAELRESDERFRMLANSTWEGIIIHTEGIIIEVNESILKMFGYPDEIVTGKSVLEFLAPESRETVLHKLRESIDAHQIHLDAMGLRKDKTIFPIEMLGRPIKYKNLDARVVAIRDITNRKQAEKAVRMQNKILSQVLNGLDALVYVTDMKTYEIIFINTYGQNIWGDITGKICWQTIQECQAAPCEFCTNSELIGPDGNPTEGVVWEFQNTVNKRWYACRDRAIYWPDGRIVRMEIATDFTFRKQAEEALEKERRRLQQVLDEVRTLRGIVPICANCKKIRDDKGFWNQVEKYVSDHTEAEFSHGICPECAQKLYPDISIEKEINVTGRPVVLLVDDEEDFRMIFIRKIKKIIKDYEYEFIEASDGEKALDLLKGGVKPCIIILDYAMPKINGMELLRRIDIEHSDLYDVPRIMMSGYSQEEIISEAQRLRCVFFEKNTDNIFYQQICQYIANILDNLAHKKGGV
jgi:PAS domain S-box-containing protein